MEVEETERQLSGFNMEQAKAEFAVANGVMYLG